MTWLIFTITRVKWIVKYQDKAEEGDRDKHTDVEREKKIK